MRDARNPLRHKEFAPMMLFCGSNTRNLMERELWAELSAAISVVEARFCDNPDFVHPTARIVRL
jgi:hypothetical protein